MSRIDLKGFGGGRLPNDDDFDEFNFGVLPVDDEDLDGEPLEENIDAINDETFGVEVDEDVMDDDLEHYSKQTAGLHLDDETPRWLDEPAYSVSAPDPSELPPPPFSFDPFPSVTNEPTSSSYSGTLCGFKMQLGTTDSLWKNVDATTSSVCSAPDLSSLQNSGFDFLDKANTNGTGLLASCNVSPEKSPIKCEVIRSLAAIPKDALTLEEIEKNHINKAFKPVAPSIPPLPSEGAIKVAELERRLLMESASSVPVPNSGNMVPDRSGVTTALSPEAPVTQLLNTPPPPIPCMPFAPPPPFALQVIRAHMLGQLPELPPGFPPITPQMCAAVLRLGPPPPLPSNAMPLPFRFMHHQASPSRPGRPPVPPRILYPPHSQMRPPMPPVSSSSHNTRSYNRDRLSKRAGLPSNKTISDFALSPFAGFMSKKEREWLIKIQLLQCQGCGNPYEDDFYYTTWRQRRAGMERRKKGLKPEDEECDYAVSPANLHHYVPPTFAGSLGKPTLSTVNYPRHLIDLSSDSPDDDDKLSMKSSTSQKKLRALLLQLENVALLIIECDDRQRILSAPSLSDDAQKKLKDGIKSRLKTVIESICSNERLQTVLLINKGRQIFARTLSFADEQQQLSLLTHFFASLATVHRRVPVNELNESLLLPVYETLSRFSKDVLTDFVKDVKWALAVDATTNVFLTNLLVSLLVCCWRKSCALKSYFPGTTLSALFRPCGSQIVQCTVEQCITLTVSEVKQLDGWANRNFVGYYPGSIAEKLIQNLENTCRLAASNAE